MSDSKNNVYVCCNLIPQRKDYSLIPFEKYKYDVLSVLTRNKHYQPTSEMICEFAMYSYGEEKETDELIGKFIIELYQKLESIDWGCLLEFAMARNLRTMYCDSSYKVDDKQLDPNLYIVRWILKNKATFIDRQSYQSTISVMLDHMTNSDNGIPAVWKNNF